MNKSLVVLNHILDEYANNKGVSPIELACKHYDICLNNGLIDSSFDIQDFLTNIGFNQDEIQEYLESVSPIELACEKHKKIVALRIVNNEDGSVMDTFYLVNPDADKLEKLKNLVEGRFVDEMNGDENPFLDNYSAIYDYIAENFQLISAEDFTIEW